jgi:uncharacterized membrane protein
MPEDEHHPAQVKRLASDIPTARIETLVDGVFAIVMTVLVFDLRVPLEDQVAQEGLLRALGHLAPNLLSYVLTFVILGVLWVGHHNQYFYIRRADRVLLWINIFFLMAVSLLPFSAGIFSRYGQESVSIIAYNSNLILAGLLMYLHWAYATRDNHLLGIKIEPEVRRIVSIRILTPPVLYLSAILVSLFSVRLSIVIDILVPIIYVLPNRMDRFF